MPKNVLQPPFVSKQFIRNANHHTLFLCMNLTAHNHSSIEKKIEVVVASLVAGLKVAPTASRRRFHAVYVRLLFSQFRTNTISIRLL
jgi:hypothetical protein